MITPTVVPVNIISNADRKRQALDVRAAPGLGRTGGVRAAVIGWKLPHLVLGANAPGGVRGRGPFRGRLGLE